jgi:hypothetical protein
MPDSIPRQLKVKDTFKKNNDFLTSSLIPGSSATLQPENDTIQNFLKKFLLLAIFTISSLFIFSPVQALGIPVENVFSDITKDYKYYDELQTLYDK